MPALEGAGVLASQGAAEGVFLERELVDCVEVVDEQVVVAAVDLAEAIDVGDAGKLGNDLQSQLCREDSEAHCAYK